MRIAVAGGTGWIGRLVVTRAQGAGHDVTIISRTHGVDLTTGEGLAAALQGSDALIDVTNSPGTGKRAAMGFFEASTTNLLTAAREAGVRHHVLLSIVGIDRVPWSYYEAKLRQEELVAAADIGWTVLRSTQFHEFPAQLLESTNGPVLPVPRMRSAPVAASEVAAHLVDLASGAPLARAPEISGPEVHEMPDLARRLLKALGRRRTVLPVRLPGQAGAKMASGALLPADGGIVGKQTFDEWLAEYARRP